MRSGLVHTAHTDGKAGRTTDDLLAALRPVLMKLERLEMSGNRTVELSYDRGKVVKVKISSEWQTV